MLAINDLEQSLQEHGEKINNLQQSLTNSLRQQRNVNRIRNYYEIFAFILIVGILQAFFLYYLTK